jgi:hypothetical protein
VQAAAARRAPEESRPNAETADLLEALRRRRGQRESAPLFGEDEHDEPAPIALFDAIEDEAPAEPEPAPQPEPSEQPSGRRKRRNAMPSWDEIVFGARTEE